MLKPLKVVTLSGRNSMNGTDKRIHEYSYNVLNCSVNRLAVVDIPLFNSKMEPVKFPTLIR